MYGQTSMSGMPDLYAENRKRLVLIVEDEYVNQELLKARQRLTAGFTMSSSPTSRRGSCSRNPTGRSTAGNLTT